MTDKGEQGLDRLDFKIGQTLREIEMPVGLEQRLLNIADHTETAKTSTIARSHSQRILISQADRILAVGAVIAIVAASVYFFAHIDARQTRPITLRSPGMDASSTATSTPSLDQLRRKSLELSARLKWLELKQQQISNGRAQSAVVFRNDFWSEQAAGTIVLAADLQQRLSDNADASKADYELVIEHFANSEWAIVARNRLKTEYKNH